MNKIKKIAFMILMMLSFIGTSQALENYGLIESSLLGEDCYQGYSNMIETSDGNILTVGQYASKNFDLPFSGVSDALIVKYDKDGKIIWKKNYSTSLIDFFSSVVELNGYYYAAGWVTKKGASFTTATNLLLVKYDKDGNQIWEKEYSIYGGDTVQAIATDGTNIALVGYASSGYASSYYYGYIATVNQDGTLLNLISSNKTAMYTSITFDGENYIVGGAYSYSNGKASLNKYSTDLTLQYSKELDYSGGITKIITATDSYYVVGDSDTNSFVLQTDLDGQVLRESTLSNKGTLSLTSIFENNGNYYVIGYTNNGEFGDFTLNNLQKYDTVVFKYDENLKLIEKNNFGTENDDVAFSGTIKDNRLYLVGYQSHNKECNVDELCPKNSSGDKYGSVTNNMNVSESTGLLASLKIYGSYMIETKVEGKGSVEAIKQAAAGSEITFTITPEKGYVLDVVKVTDKNGNTITLTNYTFTMPSSDVTIEVKFLPENPNTTDIAVLSCIAIIICGSIGVVYSIRKIRWINS